MSIENSIGIILIGVMLSEFAAKYGRESSYYVKGKQGNVTVIIVLAFLAIEVMLGLQTENGWNFWLCSGMIAVILFIEYLLLVQKKIISRIVIWLGATSAFILAAFVQSILIKTNSRYVYMNIAVCLLVIMILLRVVSNSGVFKMSWKEKIFVGISLIISIVMFVCVRELFAYSRASWALNTILVCIAAFDILLFYLIGKLNNKREKEKEHLIIQQQYDTQQKYMESVYELNEQSRRLRHDVKNHMGVLKALLESDKEGMTQKAYHYLVDYMDSIEHTGYVVHTDNDVVNAVLNAKLSKCQHEGIKTEVVVPENVLISEQIKDVDLCCIFGNILDNAIEAEMRVPGEKRSIKIYMRTQETCLKFIVMNYIQGSILEDNTNLRTTKSEKKEHGLGIAIVKDKVKDYGGTVDFYEENNYFCVNVIL